ncbi:16S rRNA (adenine(1518)-N(6)/adenine(1519)-N(6))-dimethyltransferase RsmA [Helicobacter mehlei]|uniref:Ribosomal RNA small subunit methyltransferase A n=1 Tax=Helicobacter mehlei TaxID=2316080 RepID=A0A553V0I8_9HELI|nr:16S rRNA (adenine(1518)-N(6)/adenine(1519)-N(6))-dimethyltransferase RsmA [Helicobacter mehlei]TSA85969.1 ribosomal RNA small subunit methyltransferase A [Helicobacter mehlei]
MALLGQHFLHDARYLEQILQSIPYEHFGDHVQMVEIGVGLGDLTTRLLGRLPKGLLAYEVDSKLAQRLKVCLTPSLLARLKLVVGDVMERKRVKDGSQQEKYQVELFKGYPLALSAWGFLHDGPYFLVSNLPYYIATPIITQALRDSLCLGMVVMVQAQVGIRFCASSGSSDYGALSVLASSVCNQRSLLFEVPPSAFNPPPKVQSAVIRLLKAPLGPDFGAPSLEVLESVLKICFKANRKTLFNNLKSTYSSEWVQAFFAKHQLNPTLRPHQLNPIHYLGLAHLSQNFTGEQHG